MDGKNITIGVLILVGLFLFVNSGYYTASTVSVPPAPATTPTGQAQATTPGQIICPTDPQVQLGANLKENSGQTNWGNWKYKLNGGSTATDSDGTFTVVNQVPNSYLQVLVADANSSANYRYLWNPEITVCGVNPKAYNDVTPFQTYETKCFNDDGDPMNLSATSSIAANYTVGAGGGLTVHCVLTKVAKTGMPDLNGDGQAGVLFLEMNSSTWKENEVAVKWDSVQLSRDNSYNAFKSSLSTSTIEEFKVPPFYGAGTIDFYVTATVDSTTVNPGTGGAGNTITSYGDGIAGYLIPENCHEEEDVSPSVFKCGMEDMDNTFTSPGGTLKGTAQITEFLIGVD